MSTRDTDKDWNFIAETDPFWGVLSKKEYRKSSLNSAAILQFMKSGEEYVANLFALIRKHIDPKFNPKRALDFGCGVGRLVIPLANRVEEAVGVDIAPSMLDLCRENAKKIGVTNITLCESDDTLSLVQGKFQLVNTYIVLQHISPERGYELIQSMIDRIEIGGVGSIQVTYAKSRKYFIHEQNKALYYRRDGNMLVDLVSASSGPPEGTITMYDYDLNQLMALVSRVCGHPMILRQTNDDEHLGVHMIFVKTKD